MNLNHTELLEPGPEGGVIRFDEIFRILKNEGILLKYTYLHEEQDRFWLLDYFPVIFGIDKKRFPGKHALFELIRGCGFELPEVIPFVLHFDVSDNFLVASWRKSENYLKEEIRSGISTFSLLTKEEIRQGADRLQNDLDNGAWERKFGEIRTKEHFDAGYRFLKFIKKTASWRAWA